ncbi:MAG: thiamine phosphate synthase [Magnetococcales bacterium]|nr:thiamine phosphate synthase [Magnetococcales bacterium]
MSVPVSPHPVRGIYPIIDAGWLERHAPSVGATAAGRRVLAEALVAAGVTVAQLRCKAGGGEQQRFMALWMDTLRCHAPAVRVVINDRLDLALALAADGLHVGQDDLLPRACRDLLGPGRLLGLSTHTLEEVAAAQESGADHIGYGPVFVTGSKADALATPRGLEQLAAACRASRLPVAAIGGIAARRAEAVAGRGAAAAAMIGGWLEGADPGQAEGLFLATTAWRAGLEGRSPGGEEGQFPGGERR